MNICFKAGLWKALRSTMLTAILVIAAGQIAAQTNNGLELNDSHPDRYVVKRGDTLWDISALFLKQPWFWPEIWQANPQVQNPHLIYPGDVLTLVYVDGQPRLQLSRGDGGRLSPRVRTAAIDDAITAIPYSVIEPFLRGGLVLDKKEAKSLPHIVSLKDHLIAGAGQTIYVNDLDDSVELGTEYSVLHLEGELVDPETDKVIGFETVHVGTAELRANGYPDTLFLTNTEREALRTDRLRPMDSRLPLNFFPSAPDVPVDGSIVSVIDGVSLIGQYQIVILNRGFDDGLEAGSVLAVWQKGEKVRDPLATGLRGRNIKLPDTLAGNVMVIKAYEGLSYGLVMEAISEMRVGDRVMNP